ncbi:MAG: response regulator transcription factor [Wenzhouxiangella sp.]
MTTREKALVILVDDSVDFLRSTRWLLEDQGYEVVAFERAADFEAALKRRELNLGCRGCVVSDIRMPETSGLELQRRLREIQFPLPLIFITGHADVALAVEAMRAGACNLLEKPFKPEHLFEVIEELLDRASHSDAGAMDVASRLASLTPRERQIFEMIVDGHLNKVIAYDLGISIKTVEMHRSNLMRKLDARRVTDLVRIAVEGRVDDER